MYRVHIWQHINPCPNRIGMYTFITGKFGWLVGKDVYLVGWLVGWLVVYG